ncbi:MAG: large conductance mechanosensitive channel protein MscL [Planctomycetaceae bacterium]|nr:large conductance mechanosensitive channel protein MscL [Planctomycetaceae bacterium]
MGLISEFKAFAMKGNVVDMAVGVIIGGAFGKIVTSMVGDIIMPVVGSLARTGSLGEQYLYLGEGDRPASLALVRESGQPYVAWGPFLETTINFLIIAMSIFLMVKVMNKAMSLAAKNEPKDETPPAPPEDILLLREIRDSLQSM